MLEHIDMPEIIKTSDISIVKRTHELDKELWEMLNNHRGFLGKYLNWPNRIKSIDELTEETAGEISCWDKGERFYYYILNDNRLVGGIYLLNIDNKHHSAEWGYWLSPDETGKGYISKALKALEEELFKRGFVRLVIRCAVDNAASAGVAERNGYDFEGILRKSYCNQGKFVDNKLFAKINSFLFVF
ncbi:MAG: GNAT family N-acetyltransferase [Lactobacillaceae bacterium]|jgi:ribosomal-protein-serine acetyltransferase|nr:GNAT family N-acetyltransferase [Lactobacillaceae bacterium]